MVLMVGWELKGGLREVLIGSWSCGQYSTLLFSKGFVNVHIKIIKGKQREADCITE